MFSTKQDEIISTGTHEEVLAIIKEEAKEYAPAYFDYNNWEWETIFHRIKFNKDERPGHVPFPEWNWEAGFLDDYDYSYPLKEIRNAALENPIYSETDDGDELLDELEAAFMDTNSEFFDITKELKDVLRHIRQPLWMLLPYSREDTYIPVKGFSGCDEESTEWKKYSRWLQAKTTNGCMNHELAKALQDIAANASYGGSAGIIVKLDGDDFLQWMETENLYGVLRARKESQVYAAVLDFNNGSGDFEPVILNLRKLRPPPAGYASSIVIINNLIDSTFGVVGCSKINLPEHLTHSPGSGWRNNIWL